jgi:nitroreductase
VDTDATDELLSTTRAVRRRLDLERPVERAVLLDCVRLALQAPSAVGATPWRFVIITDPDLKRGIGDVYRSAGAVWVDKPLETMPEGPVKTVTEEAQWFMGVIDQAPALVLVCSTRPIEDQPFAVQMSAVGSVLPAIWSFQLALRSRGLGSVYTTLHLWEAEAAAELLGIPEGVTQVALIPVAYTVGTDFKPARRPEPEDVVSWNTWSG